MIEAAPRRQIVIGILLLLTLAAASWALSAHGREWLRAYIEEQNLVHKVEALKLPAGATLAGMHSSHKGNPFVMATFAYEGNFEDVLTHYQREFANEGFKKTSEPFERGAVSFCTQGYAATIRAVVVANHPQGYMIILGGYTPPC